MSTFIYSSAGTAGYVKSPKVKADVLDSIEAYQKDKGKPPERVSFIAWTPINTIFLTNLQTSMLEELQYVKTGNLYVHELIDTVFGVQVELSTGPVGEKK